MDRYNRGIRGIYQNEESNALLRQARETLETFDTESLEYQVQQFRKGLEDFVRKHGEKIFSSKKDKTLSDESFRMKFHEMCLRIGVDPLSSNRSYWSSIFGASQQFYYQLSRQLIETCLESSLNSGENSHPSQVKSTASTGGLLEVDYLVKILNEKRKNTSDTTITKNDILRVIDTIKPLGSGYELVELKKDADDKKLLLKFLPNELNTDHLYLLNLAERNGGWFDVEIIQKALSSENNAWTEEKIENAINVLIRDGVCWIDDPSDDDVGNSSKLEFTARKLTRYYVISLTLPNL